MAEYVKRAFAAVAARLAYPRSVFDMRPANPRRFPRRTAAEALRDDWARVGRDLRRAAERVYGDA